MLTELNDLLSLPFDGDPVLGFEPVSKERVRISVQADAVEIERGDAVALRVPAADISETHFEQDRGYLFLKERDAICIACSAEDVVRLRQQLNLQALRVELDALPTEQQSMKSIVQCPACCLLFLTDVPGSSCYYCPHCQALFDSKQRLLSSLDGYQFNYTRKGWFSLIGDSGYAKAREGMTAPDLYFDSFRDETQPFIEKIWAHLAWVVFACLPLLIAWSGRELLPKSFARIVVYLSFPLTAVIMASLLMIGYYWSGLMLGGSFMPLFFPPRMERLSRMCQRGRLARASRCAAKWQLQEHPGALSNLALTYYQKGMKEEGDLILSRAMKTLSLSPSFRAAGGELRLPTEVCALGFVRRFG